jgi:DNA modification methylase
MTEQPNGDRPELALRYERWPLTDLQLDPRNARAHDRPNIDAIKESLERFGQRLPVVVRHGQLIGGNATTIAADELGWTHLDVAVSDDLTVEEARRLAIMLNRSAELAAWDRPVLLESLQRFDTLEGTGFSPDDLAELELLLTPEPEQGGGLTDPDAIPEPPAKPITRHGDLWLLGPHRLLCGDATKAESVARLLGDQKPTLLLTDPPYGIDYEAIRRDDQITNDATPQDAERTIREALTLTAEAVAGFVFCDWRSLSWIKAAMESAGFHPKACIVWDKGSGTQNLDRYAKRHELILYAGPYGGQPTVATDIWECQRDFQPDHPTPKPVELLAKAITSASLPGGFVYDPFGGSGSMLIAAHQTGRRALMLELDPRHVDTAARRFQEHTGTKPILEATGEPHDFTPAGSLTS